MNKAEKIIKSLGLSPHPEGGYFKETYRAETIIDKENLGPNFSGDRNSCTCIYFLLTSDTFSAFHRIKQDEIWHFYKGAPILLHVISPDGKYTKTRIGNDIEAGHRPQFVVEKEHWFAVKTLSPDSYSLLGCTVSPGFDFDDFELATRKELISKFPEHAGLISEFTRI